ncbi:hypothetical protein [Croceimicrobium hydrocarbonivorans]|uniref:Uncharacterized protein n=1 Tax=Croceimicrobium hydrocarbonivorans TaxID=2761580 RepID=A0A7H0VFL2_9FLAO|nr:hypothetical protein [Croceimicrobium hydrocarbonivorans]QNR24510.1 hypothetical protein H4K34_01310 [Croceimicrobium hydrocarbonivorans]
MLTSLMLSLIGLLTFSSEPVFTELSSAEWESQYANTKAYYSFRCSSDDSNEKGSLKLKYDTKKELLNCDCSKGSNIQIQTNKFEHLDAPFKAIDFDLLSNFMKEHKMKLYSFTLYHIEQEAHILLEMKNRQGETQYWRYQKH